jgi:hypothetical protein
MLSALSIGPTHRLLFAVLFASFLAGISGSAQELGPKEIIQRSAEVNRRDWDAAPDYDYFLRERDGEKIKTYEEIMLAGSRYERLVAIDDKPLSPQDEAKEQHRFQKAVAERQQESPDEREQRIGKYQEEIDRDHVLMGELTKALDFTLSGQQMLGRRQVYVLNGKPRAGYRPPNKQAKALTGMQGTLWIDAANFHWVKAEAEVVSPVWIYGFIARIEPGTHFELEQEPIADGLWMPSHFLMEARAKVLLLFPHYEQDDNTYSSYHKPGTTPTDPNHVKITIPGQALPAIH